MKHKIRTAHGTSKGFISPSPEMAGSGQGSGHGPASNHVQSVPMITSLSRMMKGCTMVDPTGMKKNKQHAVGWIDNVTLKESYHPTVTYKQMLISITTTCLLWRRLIRLTGGDLAPIKCAVYMVLWQFTYMNTVPYCVTTKDYPGHIIFPADEDPKKSIKIKRKNFKTSERITGLGFNPESNMTAEYEYRILEMQDLAMYMNRVVFFQNECTTIYHSRWQSRISFYLPLTTFTFSQCKRLQGAMYAALLPQMGYNRHLPKVVRHGPKHLGGSGLIHMFTEQGIKHIQHFTGTIRQSSALSEILQITFSNYQLHLGISTFFLNTNIKYCPHHIQGRIAFLWKFSNQYNITFHCPKIWTPPLTHSNDINLMDKITKVLNIASSSVNTFNACREYLQIINLSDIISKNGREIRRDILYPPTIYYPRSPLNWPYQPRPSPEAWAIWRNLLSHHFCCNDSFYLRFKIGTKNLSPPREIKPYNDFRSIIATLPAANRQALQHINFTNEAIPKIYKTLLTTTSYSASDGSVLRNEGSYGFIITTRDEKWKIKGMGLVPLTTTDQYPQRAEFYGGFAMASLLKAFYLWGGQKPLNLRTWIDNEAVTKNNSIT